MTYRRKKPKMTRKQLDRAILKLFKLDEPTIVRSAMQVNLYDYAWHLWAQTRSGKKEVKSM